MAQIKKSATKYDVCVVGGAGHVGLPFGVALANNGLTTALFDINEKNIKTILSGRFPFKEIGGPVNLKRALKKGTLFATTSPDVISKSEFIILVVGTPVDEHMNPDFSIVTKVMEKYFGFFRDGQVLILRSTLYPGTSERLQNVFTDRGKKVGIAFCPERIAQGNSFEELSKLPQIISAFDKTTLERTRKFFSKISPKTIILKKPAEAELAKLLTNAWRYIKFAVGNQFFMIAKNHDLDYYQIFKAMREDYPRNADLPSPGFAAGPCLGKDTMQLAAFNNNEFLLGHSAMLINEGLPSFLIRRLKNKFNKKLPDSEMHPENWQIVTASLRSKSSPNNKPNKTSQPLREKTIGILGMAFKGESDDTRDSLSYKLRKIARTEAKKVLCHDVYIKDPAFVSLGKLIRESDVIILAAPHEKYKNIDPSEYPDKIFVDIWNLWPTTKKQNEL